jgi:hypothetical protein
MAKPSLTLAPAIRAASPADELRPRKRTYVGKDSVLGAEEIDSRIRSIEEATGVNLDKMPVLADKTQFFRNIGRYYIPKTLAQIPSRLWHLASTPTEYGLDSLFQHATMPKGDFYLPGTGTVNIGTEPDLDVLSHEVGHWADFERNKGPYARSGLFRGREDAPSQSEELNAELAATLFARKAMGEKNWRRTREKLEAALGTYLVSGSQPTWRTAKEWWGNEDKAKADPRWKKTLPKILNTGTKQQRMAAMRNAWLHVEEDLLRKNMHHGNIFKDDGFAFANKRKHQVAAFTRMLLDTEYKRRYGMADAARPMRKAASHEDLIDEAIEAIMGKQASVAIAVAAGRRMPEHPVGRQTFNQQLLQVVMGPGMKDTSKMASDKQIKDAACAVISKITKTIKAPQLLGDTREGFGDHFGPPSFPADTVTATPATTDQAKAREKKAQNVPVTVQPVTMTAAQRAKLGLTSGGTGKSSPQPEPFLHPLHKNTGDPAVGKNHPKLPEHQSGQYPGGFFPNIGTFMRRTFTPKSYWNNERSLDRSGLPNTEASIQAHRRGLSPGAQKTIAAQKALSIQRTQAAAAQRARDEAPPLPYQPTPTPVHTQAVDIPPRKPYKPTTVKLLKETRQSPFKETRQSSNTMLSTLVDEAMSRISGHVKQAEHDCAKTHPDMTHEKWLNSVRANRKSEKKGYWKGGAHYSHKTDKPTSKKKKKKRRVKIGPKGRASLVDNKPAKKKAAWHIRTSAIAGRGLFATGYKQTGAVLVKAAERKENRDGRDRYELTTAIRFTNHAHKPNSELVKIGASVMLVATKSIRNDEEILVDYRKTASAIGPGSYITYKGKVRASADQLEKQANIGRVQEYVDQGLPPESAVRAAYPAWSDEQVAQFISQQEKQAFQWNPLMRGA